MNIFINELSLDGQYYSNEDFFEAVKVFVSIFELINEKTINKEIYRDSLFLNRQAILNEHFQASFQKIRDKSFQNAFRNIIFNKLNPKDWRQEQKHSLEDQFSLLQGEKSELVNDTTLAEAAERLICNPKSTFLLINFIRSRFSHCDSLLICKNDQMDNIIDLDCIDNKTTLGSWLEKKFSLSKVEYDVTLKDPPTDNQTVLRDQNRFAKTSSDVQGRRVYREIKTQYLWYVDNLHYGKAAHLEVFNAEVHIGEANINGEINFSRADSSKKLFI